MRQERIAAAQELMQANDIDALLILTHDDYIYFFDEDRFQPRAIIPQKGPPVVICSRAEEREIRESLGAQEVRLFATVGQQMHEVVSIMQGLQSMLGRPPTIGVQFWFETPAVLLQLFQQANPQAKVVDSAPVMDTLRMVKSPEELALMQEAARIAERGMEAAVQAVKPGVTENEVAAEAVYAMRKAGASGTAVPIFVNSGVRSLWLHGTATAKTIEQGDFVVITLVPVFEGYCVDLTRMAVAGQPTDDQRRLFDTYVAAQRAALEAVRPGVPVSELDRAAEAVVKDAGFGEHYVKGMSHGIGLRFEETPAPTIQPKHASVELQEGMTIAVGHPILAVPGIGGVRLEDTGSVTATGWQSITEYPKELFIRN
ncbi:MAG: aminopeptidase P family protein [Dehalococcoidia bacterium]|nr:MAG: aminopeptidase P family protein [Dehalococcoidia bacterium]